MTAEDKRELERNIKEIDADIIELGKKRIASTDTDEKDEFGTQIMNKTKKLRRLRRLRA
jgi:hypothetical protein